jgi:hypothetical protein
VSVKTALAICSSKDKEKNHVFRCVSFGHKKLARTVTGSNVLFLRVTLSNARNTNGNTQKNTIRSANRLTEADNTLRWMEQQPMITSITIVFKHHKLVSRLFFKIFLRVISDISISVRFRPRGCQIALQMISINNSATIIKFDRLNHGLNIAYEHVNMSFEISIYVYTFR